MRKLTLLAMWLCIPMLASAQSADLSGTVRDSSGGAVARALVTIDNENTGAKRTAVTNTEGIYDLPFLLPGSYRITVEAPGFRLASRTGVTIETAQVARLDFTLQVGPPSETVTVDANANHLPTDNPAVGLLVNRDFVENTPLNGRSFQDLLALAPGAVGSTIGGSGTGVYSFNGQHDNANYFTVDGVATNLNPQIGAALGQNVAGTIPAATALGTTQALASVDALQESKIQTSGYSAEYGR